MVPPPQLPSIQGASFQPQSTNSQNLQQPQQACIQLDEKGDYILGMAECFIKKRVNNPTLYGIWQPGFNYMKNGSYQYVVNENGHVISSNGRDCKSDRVWIKVVHPFASNNTRFLRFNEWRELVHNTGGGSLEDYKEQKHWIRFCELSEENHNRLLNSYKVSQGFNTFRGSSGSHGGGVARFGYEAVKTSEVEKKKHRTHLHNNPHDILADQIPKVDLRKREQRKRDADRNVKRMAWMESGKVNRCDILEVSETRSDSLCHTSSKFYQNA